MSKFICFLLAVIVVLWSFIGIHLMVTGDRLNIIIGTGMFGAAIGFLMSIIAEAWDI